MRAAVVDRHGPPEVLTIAEVPAPRPAPGQVRVRVGAGGVQPFDTYVRQGSPEFRMELPHQLGNEFAGRVDALGDGVTSWSVGDEVLGWAAMQSLADYVIADVDAIVAKPRDMPFEVAAVIGASGQTALTALRELRIDASDTLLVHAAAGGAGSMAVQIARHRGARVIGTASAANHDYLLSMGALPVEYGPGLLDRVRAVAPSGIDAALDAIGGQALHDSLALVTARSRIGTLVDHALAERLGVRGLRAERSTAQLRELTSLYEKGALRVAIRATYPLDRLADAHRDLETGHGAGKIVIDLTRPRVPA